jgi:hypothetical protein
MVNLNSTPRTFEDSVGFVGFADGALLAGPDIAVWTGAECGGADYALGEGGVRGARRHSRIRPRDGCSERCEKHEGYHLVPLSNLQTGTTVGSHQMSSGLGATFGLGCIRAGLHAVDAYCTSPEQ